MWTIDEEMRRLRQKLTMVRLVTGTVQGGVVVPDVRLPDGVRVTVTIEEPGEAHALHGVSPRAPSSAEALPGSLGDSVTAAAEGSSLACRLVRPGGKHPRALVWPADQSQHSSREWSDQSWPRGDGVPSRGAGGAAERGRRG